MIPTPAPWRGLDRAPVFWTRARGYLTLISLVAVVTMASLGVWQLQRATAKEAIALQIDRKSKLEPIGNLAIASAVDDGSMVTAGRLPDTAMQALLHRKVKLQGVWLHQHTVYLENRFMAGRPGFVVATPLQLLDRPLVVWVQRGWVARDPRDRTRLPTLASSAEQVTVQGHIMAEVSRIYALGATSASSVPLDDNSALGAARASRIWQNLPTVGFAKPLEVLPFAVLQTAVTDGINAPDGLLRDWLPQDSGVAKHYGYAFQWFGLCGLIMVLYAWFQLIAPRRSNA